MTREKPKTEEQAQMPAPSTPAVAEAAALVRTAEKIIAQEAVEGRTDVKPHRASPGGLEMSKRILIIDDEPDLCDLVKYHLNQEGFNTRTALTGGEALEILHSWLPDAVVLDLMLPDLSGTEICRIIRADPVLRDIAVIMLTARSEEVDRVVGFELGADDYVTKPFSPRELVLRTRAVIKRARRGAMYDEDLRIGDLLVQRAEHRAFVKGRELSLTATEFKLLAYLAATRGRVQTRDHLLDVVWGDSTYVTRRTVDTHLKRLREKLGSARGYIETIRGVGYRFRDNVV
jgi:two-component system phosphate regulon response regulator PhoB